MWECRFSGAKLVGFLVPARIPALVPLLFVAFCSQGKGSVPS